jgi:hypothetical protein
VCIVNAAAVTAASSTRPRFDPHRFFYSWKFSVGGDLRGGGLHRRRGQRDRP